MHIVLRTVGSSCGRAHDASQVWILKPCASARGIGIKLITKLQQIPRLAKYKAHVSTGGSSANPPKPCLIQSYLGQPYLVDGLKFDLRIYVAITSYDPLRIYIYPEGLARFSTEKCVPHSVPILRRINPSIQGHIGTLQSSVLFSAPRGLREPLLALAVQCGEGCAVTHARTCKGSCGGAGTNPRIEARISTARASCT